MRSYELMILLNPNLQEDEVSAFLEKIQQIITTNQGKTNKVHQWGKRILAYEIKKYHEAIYVIFDFELEPEAIANLERSIKFDEKIVRYLIVLGQEKVTAKKDKV